MSTIARYLSSALSRLSLTASTVNVPTTPHPTPTLLSSTSAFARGLLVSTSSYLKSIVADPKVSLTPVTAADTTNNASMGSLFDISLSSDTSTSSTCSDDTLPSPPHFSDTDDLFSPRRHVRSDTFLPATPSPPQLIGLGISGIPRKDGKVGNFDGLGLVGVRRSFNPGNHFIAFSEDDEDDDDGYNSPTPTGLRRGNNGDDDDQDDDELSEPFMRELVFAWEADHQHMRVLCTIPECDDELEFRGSGLKKEKSVVIECNPSPEPFSSPEPASPSSSGSCPTLLLPSPLPTPSPLTLRSVALLVPLVTKAKPVAPHVSRYAKRQNTAKPARGRAMSRMKNSLGLSNGREADPQGSPSKRKTVAKALWRG